MENEYKIPNLNKEHLESLDKDQLLKYIDFLHNYKIALPKYNNKIIENELDKAKFDNKFVDVRKYPSLIELAKFIYGMDDDQVRHEVKESIKLATEYNIWWKVGFLSVYQTGLRNHEKLGVEYDKIYDLNKGYDYIIEKLELTKELSRNSKVKDHLDLVIKDIQKEKESIRLLRRDYYE